MPDFKKGDRVTVSLPPFEAEVTDVRPGGHVDVMPLSIVAFEDNGGMINLGDIPAECVKPAPPQGWPPRVGDVWEAGGHEWFFRASAVVSDPPIAVRWDGDEQFLSNFELQFNPVLKYRRK